MISLKPLGPIEGLLNNPTLTELMWNKFSLAFAEQDGRLVEILSPFKTEQEFEELIRYLESLVPLSANKDLYFDGMLPDGSRFHVTRPMRSPTGTTLTIRKFSSAYFGLDRMCKTGFISEKASVFLKACVRARMNILISGATGSGKTTLLNALVSCADPRERVVTVEDVLEIRLEHKNWIRLIAANERNGSSVRDCLIGCLRMRPDRIIVGECRSSETLEMLQIMNTGHRGGMSTLHANSARDALTRLESLILFHAGAEIPLRALRRQVADAIDLIVHVGKTKDGKRHVEDILQVVGMEGDIITSLPIFKQVPIHGESKLLATGQVPTFVPQLEERGTSLPKNFFAQLAFEHEVNARAA